MPLPSLVSLSWSRISAARIPAREQIARWGSCGRPGSSSCRQWEKRISPQRFSRSCTGYLQSLIVKAEKNHGAVLQLDFRQLAFDPLPVRESAPKLSQTCKGESLCKSLVTYSSSPSGDMENFSHVAPGFLQAENPFKE